MLLIQVSLQTEQVVKESHLPSRESLWGNTAPL